MEKDWVALDQRYILPTYGRMPVVVKKAGGMYITAEDGITYLDLFSGLAVNVLGHCHPQLLQEMERQSHTFGHISNFFYNKPAIELAEKLNQIAFEGKVFFSNSGAESTEAAIKYVHKYGREHDREGVAVFKNSFHGRTLGALKMTRMEKIQQDFPTLDLPVYELEKEDLQQLERIFKENRPAALMFEPIFGSGGLQVISLEFIREARALCDKYNVLLCIDEIQTGVGRTGRLFAYQYAGITPDILLFAKGIGGGLPLGGILVAEKLSHYFKSGDHGTTFAPNAIAAALGKKTIEIIQEAVLKNVEKMEVYLKDQLKQLREKHPQILGDIRGKGMMIGVEILQNHEKMVKKFMEKKILVNFAAGNVLRLIPPLIIEKQHIDDFIKVFSEIIEEEQ